MSNSQNSNNENVQVTPAQLLNNLWKSMKPAYNQYVQAGGQQDMQMLLDDWAAGLMEVGIKIDNKTRLAALMALLPVIYANETDPQDMASCLMFALSSPKMKPSQDAINASKGIPVQPNQQQVVAPQSNYPQQSYPNGYGMQSQQQNFDNGQQYYQQSPMQYPQDDGNGGLPQPQW